jgi:hypothetical protein
MRNEDIKPTKHFKSHTDLTTRQTLIPTLTPFSHTYDTNTYKYLLGSTVWGGRNMRPKYPIVRQKPKKESEGGGGTLTKSYLKSTFTSLTHFHNHLTHTFLLISLTTLTAYWFSHTMHPKTHSLPFPPRETSNDEK